LCSVENIGLLDVGGVSDADYALHLKNVFGLGEASHKMFSKKAKPLPESVCNNCDSSLRISVARQTIVAKTEFFFATAYTLFYGRLLG
jgi:hypothetical protein